MRQAADRRGSPWCAQYLGAVRLLKEASAASKVQGARLTRYAAALQLQDKHRLALVQSSANRNMEVGNYRSGTMSPTIPPSEY